MKVTVLYIAVQILQSVVGWIPISCLRGRPSPLIRDVSGRNQISIFLATAGDESDETATTTTITTTSDLMEMDVILYSRKDKDDDEIGLAAMQEDGTVSPISAWTMESAFAGSDFIEFLVAEEDRYPGLSDDQIKIHSVLDESLLGYGSRQVGGGKGPGNPHGEESETCYYIERSVLESSVDNKTVKVEIKPELEITW
mmetsp:Transcript_12833/g.19511  ORF Transcript_12833/g.19511 Transcript_12833/m.19511 type:complete len:198 (-) Transcript_12833:216-809(-)